MIDAKVAVLALAAGGAGILGLGAYGAQAYGGFRGHGHGALAHKFVEFAVNEKLDEIGANEAQKQKVRAIKDRLMQEAHALRGEREAFRSELLALLEQDQVDPEQARALVRPRVEAFSRFADDAAGAVAELHAVFTPDQRRQLLAELREHLERHHR